jgi:hypothetical protein
MIVSNQSNLKVHFAGVETLPHFLCINTAKINYSLFTIFPFILGKMKNDSKPNFTNIPNIINSNSKHTIMDSGLFSLMFGAYKGQKDKKFLEKWMRLIVEFIEITNYQGTYVEVDCQKVLGVDQAWEFRNYLKKNVKNRLINVFHKEDGEKGLDKMIEFSDYIALSIPELRIIGKKDYTYRLANYIKNKKPNIDIHLLGCTENKLLEQCSFCSTSDSTSWLSPVRYGVIDAVKDKLRTRDLKNEVLISKYESLIKSFAKKFNLNLTDKAFLNYSILIYQAELLKIKYSQYAGNQD